MVLRKVDQLLWGIGTVVARNRNPEREFKIESSDNKRVTISVKESGVTTQFKIETFKDLKKFSKHNT